MKIVPLITVDPNHLISSGFTWSAYSNPISPQTTTSKQAVEYGTQSLITIEPFDLLACITSPALARVCVEAGC